MAHLFKIGDRARLNSPNPKMTGKECTILATYVIGKKHGERYVGHHCDFGFPNPKTSTGRFIILPERLEPVRPKHTGLEAYDTTATDEATKAMLKAMSEKGVAA